MTRVIMNPPKLGRIIGINPQRFHKIQTLLNLVRQVAIPLSLGATFHKAHIPGIHMTEIGITTVSKSTKQVQC